MKPAGNLLPVLAVMLLALSGCRNPIPSPAKPLTTLADFSLQTETAAAQGSPSPIPGVSAAPSGASATRENTSTPTPPLPTEETPVHLALVGDIMLGRTLAQRIVDGKGSSIFESVRPVLQSADIAEGNLECAIGVGGTKAKKGYAFLAPPAAASLLANAGFDLLSLANNHSFDYGPDVFVQTQNLLGGSGIKIVGAGLNSSQAYSAALFEVHGLRIAFLSYADVPLERDGFNANNWSAGDATPGIAWADDARIPADLHALRAQSDFLIVLFHFGTEGTVTPDARQVELAHLAVDNGADLVVGSHPHLIQKEELYKGRWIYYSLGNFVFDGFSGAYNRSDILEITLARELPITYSLIPVILVDGIPFLGQQ